MKNKYKKLNFGGDLFRLAGTAANFIPGLNMVAPILPQVGNFLDNTKQDAKPVKYNSMPDGGKLILKGATVGSAIGSPKPISSPSTFSFSDTSKSKSSDKLYEKEMGGKLVDGFYQYNAPSHAQGGQTVGIAGNRAGEGAVAEIQNKENSYNKYVYSDTLNNPETGNTFNVDMHKLVKKYSKHTNPDLDSIAKEGLDSESNRLSRINDAMRIQDDFKKDQGGGLNVVTLRKMQLANGYPLEALANMANTVNENILPNLYGRTQGAVTPLGAVPNLPSLPDMQMPSYSFPARTEQGLDMLPTVNSGVQSQSNNTQLPDIDTMPRYGLYPNTPEQTNLTDVAKLLKGVTLGKSLVDSLLPAEKENPILPNYTEADRYMQEAQADFTATRNNALSASNAASELNRNASGTFNQYRARETQRLNQQMQTLANISMEETLQNSRFNQVRGQYEAGKATDNANRLQQNRIDNLQNQAVKREFGRAFFENVSGFADMLNKEQYVRDVTQNNKELTQAAITEGMAILALKYPDINLAPDYVQKVKAGTYTPDDLFQFVGLVEQERQGQDGN